MFLIQNMRIVNAYELEMTRRVFLLAKEKNVQAFSLMFCFSDNRTPLDLRRDKLVTLIYFVIAQCPSVGTTWYSASGMVKHELRGI